MCEQDYWLSLDRYINWSSTAKSTNDFYTDWQCRQMYKDHIEHFVNRRNTFNGRLYKEDPTIFYWDLINEPRWCAHGASCFDLLQLLWDGNRSLKFLLQPFKKQRLSTGIMSWRG